MFVWTIVGREQGEGVQGVWNESGRIFCNVFYFMVLISIGKNLRIAFADHINKRMTWKKKKWVKKSLGKHLEVESSALSSTASVHCGIIG